MGFMMRRAMKAIMANSRDFKSFWAGLNLFKIAVFPQFKVYFMLAALLDVWSLIELALKIVGAFVLLKVQGGGKSLVTLRVWSRKDTFFVAYCFAAFSPFCLFLYVAILFESKYSLRGLYYSMFHGMLFLVWYRCIVWIFRPASLIVDAVKIINNHLESNHSSCDAFSDEGNSSCSCFFVSSFGFYSSPLSSITHSLLLELYLWLINSEEWFSGASLISCCWKVSWQLGVCNSEVASFSFDLLEG